MFGWMLIRKAEYNNLKNELYRNAGYRDSCEENRRLSSELQLSAAEANMLRRQLEKAVADKDDSDGRLIGRSRELEQSKRDLSAARDENYALRFQNNALSTVESMRKAELAKRVAGGRKMLDKAVADLSSAMNYFVHGDDWDFSEVEAAQCSDTN